MKIKTITLRCHYWRPGTEYLEVITDRVKDHLQDGDIVAISEKAISTALGNIADESTVKPSNLARFLSSIWTRKIY